MDEIKKIYVENATANAWLRGIYNELEYRKDATLNQLLNDRMTKVCGLCGDLGEVVKALLALDEANNNN